VPAGAYDFVRLRLAPSQGTSGDQLAGENACGAAGAHCVVMGDGRIVRLLPEGGELELRLSSDKSSKVDFLLVPDTQNQLLIEFTPVWSLVASAGEGVQLTPLLNGAARGSSSGLW
jgi:hypothetical protein